MINLSEENTALRNQIEDLVQQKQEREKELDTFTGKLDEKIDELKVIKHFKLVTQLFKFKY